MKDRAKVIVLSGGVSSERDVSLVSGKAIAKALEDHVEVQLIDLREKELSFELGPEEAIVMPVCHGTFGEDGQLQQLLEDAGYEYVGCAIEASRLCMDKVRCKACVRDSGVSVAEEYPFEDPQLVDVDEVLRICGEDLVIKPVAEGSSVGLHFCRDRGSLENLLKTLKVGRWMIERRIEGREITVGILQGKAMGIVEIIADGGVYDYKRKYTSGLSRYEYPARLTREQTQRIQADAARIFEACGCRDFARIDFRIDLQGQHYFLEVNTIPGLTETSLLPKSASCCGLNFSQLAFEMIAPALARFRHRGNKYMK